MQTSKILSEWSLQEWWEGLEAFQRKEEEKKEDDDYEEEMEGKRRDEEDMKDSLVLEEGMILKFPLVYFATFAAPASRFFPPRRS